MFRFSQFIKDKTGLYFPKERWEDLYRGIRTFAGDLDGARSWSNDPTACIDHLMSHPRAKRHMDKLVEHLTVGETY